jgi:hypothetical protein
VIVEAVRVLVEAVRDIGGRGERVLLEAVIMIIACRGRESD